MATSFDTRPIIQPASPLDFSWQTNSGGTGNLSVFTKTTDQQHCFGRRYIDDLGKVYRYGKSGALCYTGRGNVFYQAATATPSIDYATLAYDANVGDSCIKMTNTIATAITENALAGGQICIKPTEVYTDAHLMMRTIVANSAAAASSGICAIYLNAPIETALTTSNYAFAMPSPWVDIRYTASSGGKSFAGLAAIYISASGYYFWTQVRGLCWIAPQTTRVGAISLKRAVFWREDGSVDAHSQIGTNVTDQVAGYVVDNNDGANGSTIIMLTCDI